MKWTVFLVVFIVTFTCLTASAERVIILFKDTLKVEDLQKFKEAVLEGQRDIVSWIKKLKNEGKVRDFKQLWIVNGIFLDADEDVIKRIRSMKKVEIIPDYIVKLNSEQIKSGTLWNLDAIDVEKLWKYGVNGSGVKVAVIDTGIQHPDLMNKIVDWKDLVNNKSYPYDDNDDGHGTHVAGIIAGSETGVAPGVKLIGVKVFDSQGNAMVSTVIEGFQWAVERGADILSYSGGTLPIETFEGSSSGEIRVNVKNYVYEEAYKPSSLVVCLSREVDFTIYTPSDRSVEPQRINDIDGYHCWCYNPNHTLENGTWRIVVTSSIDYKIYVIYPSDGSSLIDRVVNNLSNVVVVCAAGNEGYYGFRTINSPASARNAIAVGAVDSNLNIAWFSSKGPVGFGENFTIKPDVVAPGVRIFSTYPRDGYTLMSGTSMSTPHVSGVIALMLQVNRTLTPNEIKNVLEKTSIDLGAKGKDFVYGAGLINAYYAVLNVTSPWDVYIDGAVNINDVSYVANMIVDRIEQDLRADFNENGRVDIGDLARITYYVLSKSSV